MSDRSLSGVLPVRAILSALLLCLSMSSLLGQSLQITSPADGTTVNPGQTLTVTVNASGTFQQVILIGSNPMGFSQMLSNPPYQFTIQIPTTISPGWYSLTADSVTSPGQGASSNPCNRLKVRSPMVRDSICRSGGESAGCACVRRRDSTVCHCRPSAFSRRKFRVLGQREIIYHQKSESASGCFRRAASHGLRASATSQPGG